MSDPISEGVVAYFESRTASWPKSNMDAVDPLIRHKIEVILSFADTLEPDWTRLHNLEQAGEWARAQFASQYPYLTDEALGALVGSCTFGWK